MYEYIGVGVGKQTHTLVLISRNEDNTLSCDTEYIANSIAGLDHITILAWDNPEAKVIFVGNKRWATPLAYGLRDNDIEPLYFPIAQERGSRGKKGKVATLLVKALGSGVQPKAFFRERKNHTAEELSVSYRLASEYVTVANEVREAKHHLLDGFAILFPEAVKAGTTIQKNGQGEETDLPVPQPQPPDLFTKKMRSALANPVPRELENDLSVPSVIRELASKSLGKYVPVDLARKTLEDHRDHIRQYDAYTKLKDEKITELKKLVVDHPLTKVMGDGDVAAVIIGFLGWQQWEKWRHLRHFCGLDVSVVDAKGKAHISRVRPSIRQYLYLFATLTTLGKQVTAGKKGKVKKIEALLKYLYQNGLKKQHAIAQAAGE